MITVRRESEEEITFQLLYDDTGEVVDVDLLTDISVELIHSTTRTTIATYDMSDLIIDNTDDTITILLLDTDTTGARLGKYNIRVSWAVANALFPDGQQDRVDEIAAIILKV